jgi:hypothetical protein
MPAEKNVTIALTVTPQRSGSKQNPAKQGAGREKQEQQAQGGQKRLRHQSPSDQESGAERNQTSKHVKALPVLRRHAIDTWA